MDSTPIYFGQQKEKIRRIFEVTYRYCFWWLQICATFPGPYIAGARAIAPPGKLKKLRKLKKTKLNKENLRDGLGTALFSCPRLS